MNSIKKNMLILAKLEKLASILMVIFTKMWKTLKIRKISDNFWWLKSENYVEFFRFVLFSHLRGNLFPHWLQIFSAYNWNLHIFSILFLVLVLLVKKYIDFSHKLGIRRIESKKYNNFRHKSGRLQIQIKDDYHIYWKNVSLGKFFNNFL